MAKPLNKNEEKIKMFLEKCKQVKITESEKKLFQKMLAGQIRIIK